MPSFIGSIPTVDETDIEIAQSLLKNGPHLGVEGKVKQQLESILDNKNLYFFNRGREALYVALKALGVSHEDEVLVQAMTCSAVIAPILCLGAKPIYIDISKETYNISIEDLKKKISPETKVLIAQHTFGRFAEMEKIQKVCRANGVKVIEDCAHLFRNDIQETVVGKFSDISIFSFAQDKAISSVTGGLLVVNNLEYKEKVYELHENTKIQTEQEAKYPLLYLRLWDFAKRYYFTALIPFQKRITIGKAAIMVSRWLGITKQQASENLENVIMPTQMSDVQYTLLDNQIKKLNELNSHRRDILKIYDERSTELLIRYPVLVENPDLVLNQLSQNRYLCGRWYNSIVFPVKGSKTVSYMEGSCPAAEYIVKHIINLPLDMDVTEQEAINIKNIVSKFLIH